MHCILSLDILFPGSFFIASIQRKSQNWYQLNPYDYLKFSGGIDDFYRQIILF